jgi:hypothetical protein
VLSYCRGDALITQHFYHTTMRICVAISVAVHAAVMLWLVLVPGKRPFDPAQAEPILVELLRPQEAPEQPKQETQKQETQKPQEPEQKPSPDRPKGTDTKSAEIKSADIKSNDIRSDDKGHSKADSKTAAQNDAEDRAATAARLARMLNLQTDTAVDLVAPPSEGKSSLTSEEIAAFKTQVSKCWVPPDGGGRSGDDILIRIALGPDGKLSARPELIRAPASVTGPPLVASAKRALQQCQPYAMLPADKYQDWRVLDLTFTADGPTGLAGPSRRSAATR